MINFIFTKNRIELLEIIFSYNGEGVSISKIARKSQKDSNNIRVIISSFEKAGLISTKCEGRERKVYITSKGDLFVQKLREVRKMLGEYNG